MGANGNIIIYEWCSFCDVIVEIPDDGLGICPSCKRIIFPCSDCDEICTYNIETDSCHRF